MDKKQKGFTLVEMIIVTVIIGILAGIVITVINIPRVQARSRDSKRIGDIKRIQTALELYFADNRQYPVASSSFIPAQSLAITPSYIDQIPTDPLSGNNTKNNAIRCMNNIFAYGYYYLSDANGARYVITAINELPLSTEDPNVCFNVPNCDTDITGIECGGSSDSSPYCYCVQNPM